MAQGRMKDRVFMPEVIGFPPGETRMESLVAMDVIDTFGVVHNVQGLKEMTDMAAAAQDVMFIYLSDVHLDDPSVGWFMCVCQGGGGGGVHGRQLV